MPTGIHDGPRGPKRTREQRKLHRALMVRWIGQGCTMSTIAQRLGVHRRQVEKDWKRILDRLVRDYNGDPAYLKARQMKQLEALKLAAWKAFQWYKGVASEEATKKLIEHIELLRAAGMEFKLDKEMVVKLRSKNPDPALLQVIEKCLKAERDLEGLEPPKRAKLQLLHGISYDEIASRLPQNGEAIPDQSATKLAALEQEVVEAGSSPSPQPLPSEPTNGSGTASRNGHGERKVDL